MSFEDFCLQQLSCYSTQLNSFSEDPIILNLDKSYLENKYQKCPSTTFIDFSFLDYQLLPIMEKAQTYLGPISLSLRDQKVSDIVLISVGKLLFSKSVTLVDLDISNNPFLSLNSFSKLFQGVSNSDCLRSLIMRHSTADLDSKRLLINAIIEQQKLVEVDLGYLGNRTLNYLTIKLPNVSFLRHLNFQEGFLKRPERTI